MKHFKFYLFFCLVLSMSAMTMVSCGGSDDNESGEVKPPVNGGGTPSNQCYTEPTSILLMSDGFAFRMNFGSSTKYFYWNVYTQASYNKKSEQEIISEMTKDTSKRVTPSNDDVFSYYGATAYTQYVIVTISYDGDKMGDFVTTPVTTKSTSNQPYTTLYSSGEDENVDKNSIYNYNNNYFFCWYAEKNAYCKEYYTYAAAANSKFATYKWMESGNTVKIAFYIWQEIQKNGEDHSTSINEMQMGREKFYAKQFNNNWSFFPCAYGSDKYCQVVTWGTSANDELSGLIKILYWDDISYSSASRAKVHIADNNNGEGVKEMFSIKDFDNMNLIRIKN